MPAEHWGRLVGNVGNERGKEQRAEGRAYNICDVVCYFKFTICSGALGMNYTFWNTFSVEVGEQIDKMKVLQQQGSICSDPIRCLRVEDRTTVGCCVYSSHGW
jgi:hypothetical protein